MTKIINRKPLFSAIAMISAFGGQAYAQEDDDGLASLLMLEEIIVIAQKREQDINEVPVAVTALDARLLEAAGINDPSALTNVIPNFAVSEYQGELKINIRGVGQFLQASNPGIAIHVDGVYQPRSTMAGLTQIDMAGVEVLRGPQGTTYGRNANGGAVNYTTNAATDEFEAYVKLGYAEYEETRLQGAINVPFSDAVRARLTLEHWERGEGFFENVGDGEDLMQGDTLTARLRVDADITDSLSATFIVNHLEREGDFQGFTHFETPNTFDPFGFGYNEIFLADGTFTLDPSEFATDMSNLQEREYQSFAAIFNWDINDTFSLKSITAQQNFEDFRSTDLDALNANVVGSLVDEEADTFTQEFNLVFNADWGSGVVGAFYLDDELEGSIDTVFMSNAFFAGTPIFAGTAVPATWEPYTTTSTALFTDVNIDLTDSLSLILGVRYAEEDIEFDQRGGFLPAPPPADFVPPPGFSFPPPPPPEAIPPCTGALFAPDPIRFEEDFTITTPKVGVAFKATDDNNLYATYSEGFKAGGYGLRTGCGNYVEEETVNSYEIGSKNVFADGRVRLNITAFYYDYEGYQLEQLVGLGFERSNLDEVEVMGIEFESTMVLTDNLTLLVNGSFQDSEILEHTAFDSLNPMAGFQDVSGSPVPNTPDSTFNASVIYEMENGLAFQLNAAYKSEINFREFGNSADAADAYTVWNASIRWASEDDTINARLFANNLTDEEYRQAVFTSSLTGTRIGNYGAPRQIGAEIKYSF